MSDDAEDLQSQPQESLPAKSGFNASQVVWWMLGGLAVLVSVWALSQPSAEEEAAEEVAKQALIDEAMGTSEVVYEVEGSVASSAHVTVTTPTGTEQATPSLPMRNQAGGLGLTHEFEPGEFVYISAQNEGEYGSATCRITVDSEVVSENTSSGAYGIATCEGRS